MEKCESELYLRPSSKTTSDDLDLNELEARACIVRAGDLITLHDRMLGFASRLGTSTSVVGLEAYAAADLLPVHTECVYLPRPIRYFLLGCVRPADEGGETTVYDSRNAAQLIISEHPELADVTIEYSSASHGTAAIHRLVVEQRIPGQRVPTLLFRERVATNRVVSLSAGWDDEGFYSYVRAVLARSKITSHHWRVGDVLIVYNSVSLHGREPFRGLRQMIRVRVDEPADRDG